MKKFLIIPLILLCKPVDAVITSLSVHEIGNKKIVLIEDRFFKPGEPLSLQIKDWNASFAFLRALNTHSVTMLLDDRKSSLSSLQPELIPSHVKFVLYAQDQKLQGDTIKYIFANTQPGHRHIQSVVRLALLIVTASVVNAQGRLTLPAALVEIYKKSQAVEGTFIDYFRSLDTVLKSYEEAIGKTQQSMRKTLREKFFDLTTMLTLIRPMILAGFAVNNSIYTQLISPQDPNILIFLKCLISFSQAISEFDCLIQFDRCLRETDLTVCLFPAVSVITEVIKKQPNVKTLIEQSAEKGFTEAELANLFTQARLLVTPKIKEEVKEKVQQ